MSILVILVLYEGLIFGADRNITTLHRDGTTKQQNTSPKVLNWPNSKCLFGFAGAAQMGNVPMVEWLEKLRPEFEAVKTVKGIASELHKRVQDQRAIDDARKSPEPLVIHLGGFEKKQSHWVPVVWHIGNIYKLGQYGYLDFRREYFCTEAFGANDSVKDIDPTEIRRFLKVRAKQFEPFWIHQGLDLFTFNVLEGAMKSAFRLLCQQHPNHDIPTTLDEWAKHVKMQVLMYGAYFEAFNAEGERFVGGGADIVSLAWPD